MIVFKNYMETQATFAELGDLMSCLRNVTEEREKLLNEKLYEYYNKMVNNVSFPMPLKIIPTGGPYIRSDIMCWCIPREYNHQYIISIEKYGCRITMTWTQCYIDIRGDISAPVCMYDHCNNFSFITSDKDALHQIIHLTTVIYPSVNVYRNQLLTTR
jgi:hypothetical protein